MPSIVEARAWQCDIPVLQARTDAVQEFLRQETVLVEVQTDDGATGVGYSYTIGTGGRAVLALLRGYLLPKLMNQDVTAPEAIWERLRRSTLSTMVGPITTLALAAIDTAVWDVRAKLLDVSLWRLAGGAQVDLAVYDTEGGWLHFTVDELVVNAARAIESGCAGVKVKVGKPSPAEDVERLRAVRETIGAGVSLMVDANQGFTRDEAQRRARSFEQFDLTWLEEPLPADDVDGHAQLSRSTCIPLAVGETLYSLGQFRDYLVRDAALVLQPDVARIGGITPWLKVAHLAQAFEVPVAPHFLMELHVSLAAAVPNGRWLEWIPELREVTRTSMNMKEGRAVPPDDPGIGILWDMEALERHRVASSEAGES